jgi:hypothetical protein
MHYHHDPNDPDKGQAASYVYHTLLKNLKQWKSPSGHPVRAIGITHPVILEASLNPPRFLYSPDLREQEMLFRETFNGMNPMGQPGTGNFAPMFQPMPMPMSTEKGAEKGTETDPEKKTNIKEIRQTRFRVQFIWQPVPKEEREVNDIIMNLVAPERAVYNPDPSTIKAEPKLDVPLSAIEEEVNKLNAAITAQNEENKNLPPGDPNRQLNRELLKVSQEQYDAFKTRFLTKGTAETSPMAIKATAVPTSGEMPAM